MPSNSQTILITGGGRGIGRGVALAFAGQGTKVAVSARSGDQLEQVAEEIEAAGGQALPIVCDVTKQEDVDNLAKTLLEAFGPPDVLVNNAGMAASHKFLGHPDELWFAVIDVNLHGPYRVTKALAPAMVEKGGGRVIMVASAAAKTAWKYTAAYTASKHGLLGLTRTLAIEFNPYHITVNAICPGYVDTPMTDAAVATMVEKAGMSESEARAFLENLSPQKRLMEVDEVAALAVFLASPEARGITGQALFLDGGAVMD